MQPQKFLRFSFDRYYFLIKIAIAAPLKKSGNKKIHAFLRGACLFSLFIISPLLCGFFIKAFPVFFLPCQRKSIGKPIFYRHIFAPSSSICKGKIRQWAWVFCGSFSSSAFCSASLLETARSVGPAPLMAKTPPASSTICWIVS